MIILEDHFDENDTILAKINDKVIISCGCQIFVKTKVDTVCENYNVSDKEKQQVIDCLDNLQEETDLVSLVKKDFRFLVYIHNPSEAAQLASVNKCGDSIRYIHNPSEAVQLAADSIFY